MENFNLAFFSLYENVYLTYSELHGSKQALNFIEKLFAKALGKAYLAAGFSKGNVEDFAKVVKERVKKALAYPYNFPSLALIKLFISFIEILFQI